MRNLNGTFDRIATVSVGTAGSACVLTMDAPALAIRFFMLSDPGRRMP